MGIESARAFRFTENGIEQAIRLVRDGLADTNKIGRRIWRDEGSPHGLHVYVGGKSATYYRVAKVAGKKLETRIGDATAMRLTKAREKARALAAGVKEAAAAPIRVRTDGPTVGQAWTAYVAATASGEFIAGRRATAKSTLDSYVALYNTHLQATYETRSLHALAKDVQAIHKRLHTKPVTANRLLQVMSNLFVHAARSGIWEKPNPTLDPITGRTIRKYPVESRSRWFTTAEAARILAYAATEGDPWRDFWPLLILTGVRVSNLREMKWPQLDLRDVDATWSIPMTKNREPHVVALSPQAADILRARYEAAPKTGTGRRVRPTSPWVFPMKEDPARCIADCDNAWARVKKHAPLDDARIHDLRRTAASWATQAGVPQAAVGMFIGDKSPSAIAVYARADVASKSITAKLVAERLEEAGGLVPKAKKPR